MKSFDIRKTLLNRDAVLSTFWSTLQQIVVAASTFFILKAIASVTSGDTSAGMMFIGFFVASLVLVYVPNTVSMLYLQRWRISSLSSFVSSFIEHNKGQAPFGHARNKSQTESWLTNESFTVYDTATNLLYQIYSTALNSAFNILIIAVSLDRRLLLWYLAAGVALVSAHFVFKKKISNVSLEMQQSRKDLSNAMLSAWDNVFIGNQHNLGHWLRHFEIQIRAAKSTATRYDGVRSLISSATVCVALVVVAIGNGIFLFENAEDVPKVAALLITLPRQLQIIQSIFAFFNLTLSWAGTSGQLKELEKIVRLSAADDESEKFIDFDVITFSDGNAVCKMASLHEADQRLTQLQSGRWTLRGRNGAGKSTLLAALKKSWGDNAFLLPSRFGDLRFTRDFQAHSDGNRLLAVFAEISQLQDVKAVLLDEWDANLDGENLTAVSLAIDELARTKLVLESRHRGTSAW